MAISSDAATAKAANVVAKHHRRHSIDQQTAGEQHMATADGCRSATGEVLIFNPDGDIDVGT